MHANEQFFCGEYQKNRVISKACEHEWCAMIAFENIKDAAK